MKAINKIFSTLGLATLLLGIGACTDEYDYTPAQQVNPDCIKASFTSDGDFMELDTDAPKSVTVTVRRENTSDEVTLALNVLRNDENVFQIPVSVTFAAGQSTATFEIAFPNAEIGLEYTYCIALDDDVVDPYSSSTLASTTGTIQLIQWNLLGTSHAAWYRAEEPIETGMDIIFIVNDDNSVSVADQPIFTDSNYGTVYVNNSEGGGIYSAEDNTIQAALYYYCSAGYFGTYVETLTLPAE